MGCSFRHALCLAAQVDEVAELDARIEQLDELGLRRRPLFPTLSTVVGVVVMSEAARAPDAIAAATRNDRAADAVVR